MSRTMVGLLAAVAAAMSACVGLFHGDLVPVMMAIAGGAAGLAAYGAAPAKKNISGLEHTFGMFHRIAWR